MRFMFLCLNYFIYIILETLVEPEVIIFWSVYYNKFIKMNITQLD